MKELVYRGVQKVAWEEVDAPTLRGARSALIKPLAATPCDLDYPIIEGRLLQSPPFGIGHFCVGVVEELGSDVRQHGVGDVVILSWYVHCGECDQCRAGAQAYCRLTSPMPSYGVGRPGLGGTFADLVYVPFADAQLLSVPAGLSPLQAVEVGDTIPRVIEYLLPFLQTTSDRRVLVIGAAGAFGLFAVQLATSYGAIVSFVDPDPKAREYATMLGAASAVDMDDLAGKRFDFVFDSDFRSAAGYR